MQKLLYLQLQNEKALDEKCEVESRNGLLTDLLLKISGTKIKTLEGLVDAEQKSRQKVIKPRCACGASRYVLKALHRLRHHKDGRNRPVFEISEKATPQAQEGAK